MTQTPTPDDSARLNQIEEAIVQLSDGQNVLMDAMTRLINSQIRLEDIVGTTRREISQSIAGINQSIAGIDQSIAGINATLASVNAALEQHDRILDYLLRRDGETRP